MAELDEILGRSLDSLTARCISLAHALSLSPCLSLALSLALSLSLTHKETNNLVEQRCIATGSTTAELSTWSERTRSR